MNDTGVVQPALGGARHLWPKGRYVVGVDGSNASTEALAYAVRMATATDSTVEAVLAWQSPLISRAASTGGEDESAAAELLLAHAIEAARVWGDLRAPITATVREGSATAILREVSADADLLIVGSRGRGGFEGLLLGSVSASSAEHATCPVVVVRGSTATSGDPATAGSTGGLRAGHYVVGIDGGRESVNVLRHAVRLAASTHSTLHIVTAWHDPGTFEPIAFPRTWTPESDAEDIISRAVKSVFGDSVPDWVTAAAIPGRTAEALVKQSASATLLIVGSRGHGGFAGLLLGSVSAACARHALGPVLIVHGTRAVLPAPAERDALDV